jgi:TorA maturation chaperone TorD
MSVHSHDFVETYKGLVGFGLDRQTDENTIIYYLQKFSDDELMQVIKGRLQDQELADLFDMLSNLLSRHLNEDEYHRLFLKEEHSHGSPA